MAELKEKHKTEVEELKAQLGVKKAEHKKNIELAKNNIDILKDQVKKCKQII